MQGKRMNTFILTSFFTEHTAYEQIYYKHLYNSLIDKALIMSNIQSVANLGSWNSNTGYKPTFLLQQLECFKDKNIVWIDCDAEIREYPKLFNEIPKEYDIAFYTLDWNEWYGYKDNPPKKEVLTGTLFLRNNDKIKDLCKEWAKQVKESGEWEQKVLQRLINKRDIKVYPLPIEYCYIATLPNGKEPKVEVKKPIITHFQASRKCKRLIHHD